MGDTKLRAQECSSSVDLQRQVELLRACLFDRELVDGGRIIDTDVDATKLFDCHIDSVLNALFVSNIALDWEALSASLTDLLGSCVDCARELWMRRDGLSRDGNVSSVSGSSQNDGESDSSGGATDKDGLAFEALLPFELFEIEDLDIFKYPSRFLRLEMAIDLCKTVHDYFLIRNKDIY